VVAGVAQGGKNLKKIDCSSCGGESDPILGRSDAEILMG
jgi:hypothetical protein